MSPYLKNPFFKIYVMLFILFFGIPCALNIYWISHLNVHTILKIFMYFFGATTLPLLVFYLSVCTYHLVYDLYKNKKLMRKIKEYYL